MKRKVLWAAAAVLILLIVYFVVPGFTKQSFVYIGEYTVSPDGREITFDAGIAASTGYIRTVKVHQQQGGKLYLDFYSAFGGFNGSIGARHTFTVPLNEDTSIIAVYRNRNAYEEVLIKADDGTWQRVQ